MGQEKKTAFCSNCLKTVDFRCVTKTETAIVRGVKVLAEHTHCFCMECGEEIVVNSILDENLKNSFEAYKKQVGLLTGQEIRSFREQYHLTAVELSTLLGAGEKTITRYENGAIQDPVYDKLLRNLMAREAFYLFLVQNRKTIDSALYQRLIDQMKTKDKEDMAMVFSYISSLDLQTKLSEEINSFFFQCSWSLRSPMSISLDLPKKGVHHGNKTGAIETQPLSC